MADFKSNLKNVQGAVADGMRRAAEIIGGIAESYAKEACHVDTGLLRNSITYAIGGEGPHITEYTDNKGEQHGTYEGTLPADSKGQISIVIGTNVEYGPYMELRYPYLRPAIDDHRKDYKEIFETEMKEG